MPQLLNRRHELFARALASGESASTAYRAAGYQCAPHKARGHGYRLRTREDIAARVQELIDKPQNRIATQQIVEAIRTGRPTIYRPELATLARKLALLGATDQEMADALGIDQGTLDRWKTRHKEFRVAIQLGKIRADAEIAESLYNRARGMSVPAVKIFQGTPEGGPVIVPHQEHLPPDVGAAKLWLSRRRPNLWRERQQVDVTATVAHQIAQMTPGADAEIAESLYNRARGMSVPAVKIFQGTPEAGPVIVPHQEHLPPDVGAAKLWLSRRQPERWKERQEVDFSGTLEHRLNQMTPEERAADAVELMARVRRRLAEYRQTIEHEAQAETPDEDEQGNHVE